MKLSFVKPYLSITSLDDIDLPQFTLISGVNGSGKTHLLKAISSGDISTDLATDYSKEIRYFDWKTLIPNNSVKVDSNQTLVQRSQFITSFENNLQPYLSSIVNIAKQHGIPSYLLDNPRDIPRLKISELIEALGDKQKADAAYQAIENVAKNATTNALNRFGNNQKAKDFFENAAQFTNKHIWQLSDKELDEIPLSWGQTDVFQHSFAELFLAYRHLIQHNVLKREAVRKGDEKAQPLSDEDFEAQYGKPPWDFINEILESANLDFSINHPELYGYSAYLPILKKKGNNAEIRFEHLSSGEQILMAFAFCLYYAEDTRQIVSYPRILLFDEIDAPLHPSRSRLLLNTIIETLVNNFNIYVIMTTHSPSTIAVAPPESVYVMQEGTPGLQKVSQRQAIDLLTKDIPALSISFHGKRQVFVEDQKDAERYHRLFGDLYGHMKITDRYIEFIGVGKKNPNGTTENTGCSQVYTLTEKLSEAGNETVFGLVDWDLTNLPNNRVFVLSYGLRYAIENCLLDPLLVLCAAIREDRSLAKDFGISVSSYTNLAKLDIFQLQSAIDIIQSKVLGVDKLGESCREKISYLSGLELQVSQKYLHYQGHALEKSIKNAIPQLRRHHQDGKLLTYIIDHVLPDHPLFTPKDLLITFESILTADA
ncbi:MAG: ATP-binding protein [Calothrix sp. MO_167.B42]|nr:ATP-binding protein [Calothrix sp. MO_167.B42]